MNENKPMVQEDFIGPFLPEVPVEPEIPFRRPAKGKLVTTLTLTDETCRWPFGDPAGPDFYYCGERPLAGGVYCETHDIMSRPASTRRKSS